MRCSTPALRGKHTQPTTQQPSPRELPPQPDTARPELAGVTPAFHIRISLFAEIPNLKYRLHRCSLLAARRGGALGYSATPRALTCQRSGDQAPLSLPVPVPPPPPPPPLPLRRAAPRSARPRRKLVPLDSRAVQFRRHKNVGRGAKNLPRLYNRPGAGAGGRGRRPQGGSHFLRERQMKRVELAR